MSYFIIIRGPLGIGKSSIAEELAKRLDALYVPIDEVLERHGLDKIGDEGCIPLVNFLKADECILPDVQKAFAEGKIVIFDACFYHREHIEHIIEELNAPHYVFTLKAPVEICIERDHQRQKTHGEAATRAVHSLVSRFEYGTTIDVAKLTFEQTMNKILNYLPKSE